MTTVPFTRRQISFGAVAAVVAGSATAFAQMGNEKDNRSESDLGISRGHAAIHQEIDFAAGASRLYQTLTNSDLFDKVVLASAAVNSAMKAKLGSAPTGIDARPGGAFVLFGGYITGYMLELVPDARVVQAWRSASWDPGIHSIAKFQLAQHGSGSRLIFDHTGFPDQEAEHLAQGWRINYWEPLKKVLA